MKVCYLGFDIDEKDSKDTRSLTGGLAVHARTGEREWLMLEKMFYDCNLGVKITSQSRVDAPKTIDLRILRESIIWREANVGVNTLQRKYYVIEKQGRVIFKLMRVSPENRVVTSLHT